MELRLNSYFHNYNEERCLEFIGTYLQCKHEIMNQAAVFSGGLYIDEAIPGENWYLGTGIYAPADEEGLELVYSIYLDHFEHKNDKYEIIQVENEVALMCELGGEKEFFMALMDKDRKSVV